MFRPAAGSPLPAIAVSAMPAPPLAFSSAGETREAAGRRDGAVAPPAAVAGSRRRVLIVSPGWLGDVVMALPAFRAWRALEPDADVTVLAKPRVAALWRLCEGVDRLLTLAPGLRGTRRAAWALRRLDCDAALLLPGSFRAAWIAWRAGVPRRRGTAGQMRGRLLTERVSLAGLERAHQAIENYRLFGLAPPAAPPAPRLEIPAAAAAEAREIAGLRDGRLHVALLPGAARGDAKRWPAEHFAAAARRLAEARPETRFLVCGTSGETAVCRQVAGRLGDRATDLAGRTSLTQLAALLSQCRAVCCNDSGGMHLAAAVGVPVVAVFGLTDPRKTGPLGPGHRIIAPPGVRPARAVPRRSAAAARLLASVPPENVAAALEEVLAS